jgi:serine protease
MSGHVSARASLILVVCLLVFGALVDATGGAEGPTAPEVLLVDEQSGVTPEGVPEAMPGVIIVKFDPNVPDEQCDRIVREHGCCIACPAESKGLYLVDVPADTSPLQMTEAFAAHAEVLYAELNYYVWTTFVPNDALYSYQWNFDNAAATGIRMREAWDLQKGDPNVIVAVVDTGVAYEDFDIYKQAPDLAATHFVPGYDFVHDDNHPNDDHGHGTHVAGTIAQSTNNKIGTAGVAFGCSIMPLKAMDEEGIGDQFTVARAILLAVDHDARVINLSLGSPETSNTLRDAVKTAYQRDVTVVAAAGNNYANGNQPSYPAAYTNYCIAVGAVRYDRQRAPYSNTGPYLSVVAPGGDLTVDQNADGYADGILQQTFRSDPNTFAYWFFQGTSMATPHVSGLAALLASRGVTKPDKIKQAIELTARDLGPAGWDQEYGWGLIDAYAALAYHVPGDRNGDNVVDAKDLAAP